jgi:hypothetical protein
VATPDVFRPVYFHEIAEALNASDSDGAGPILISSDLLFGIMSPWTEKPKQAQSFVSCGETVA